MSFDRFDNDDHEPAAVVRTLADLSLMLVLTYSMIVGAHPPLTSPSAIEARAATKQAGERSSDVHVALTGDGKFILLPAVGEPVTVGALASQLLGPGKKPVFAIVLQFPTNASASQLHTALLHLQTTFTNTAIQTIPGT